MRAQVAMRNMSLGNERKPKLLLSDKEFGELCLCYSGLQKLAMKYKYLAEGISKQNID